MTATLGDSAQHATVHVTATPPLIVSLTPTPYVLQHATTGIVTVMLDVAPATDTIIALSTSAPATLQIPRSVTVPRGRMTADFPITALTPGAAVLSATANGRIVSATVQVAQPTPKVASVLPLSTTVPNGTPALLTVHVSAAPTEPTPVSLVSSAATIVEVPSTITIPADSLSAEVPVVTRRQGDATVTATVNGSTASAQVTVTAAELLSLAVSPAGSSVALNENQAFQALGTYTDGTTEDLTPRVTWRSADQKVAATSSAGVVTGLTMGTTTVTAAAGALTARVTVTVAASSNRLTLSAPLSAVAVGQSLAFTVSLATPAQSGNVTVLLSAGGTGAVLLSPTSVVIPAGQRSAPFNVTATRAGTVALTATASGMASASSALTISEQAGLAKGAPGRPLTGRVLSATDAKPLAGVRLTLAGQSATTDANGAFLFPQPPSGYQLVKIDQVSIESHRKPLKDGSLGGHMHADPVLVNVSSEHANELLDPIYVVQTHPTVYTIAPGARADIRPTHIPGLKLSIPDGTTIKAEDGQPQSQVSITPVRPDRVPRIPDDAAPRTIYLVSFEKHGGGVPTKPVPVTMPNDLGADPGSRIEFWYYDKSPMPDPTSHKWKLAGYGRVSPDGRSLVPDPGVGMPSFCYAYPKDVNATNITQRCPDPQNCPTAADPVDVTSGVFSLEKTDLVLPGVLPVHITRLYRSKAEGIGPFGQGGSFNYHMYLTLVGAALRLQMPDMNRHLFSQEADGKYRNTAHPLFKGAAITRFADLSAELRWRDGMVYVFNPSGWLIEQRDRYNNKIQIIRDGTTDRIVEVREPSGRALKFTYTTTKRGHDTFDVIGSITDPLGRVVTYTYYVGSNGRLSRVTDPAGGSTTYTYGEYNPTYYWNEGMLTITDARGITYLRNEYDLSGRVAKQTLADGGTYTFTYTTAGQTITQTQVTDPRGHVTTYQINVAQYVSQIDRPGPTTYTTTFEREAGTNKLTAVVDSLSRRTEYTYDANGNVVSIKDPENNTTVFEYESTYSRLTKITDALTPANITQFAYNDTNRTTTITDPEGKQTVIQYNTAGQLTNITDPLTHVTSFGYDSQGNLTTTTDALSNVTTRHYDAVSRLIALTDPHGKLTRFSYDDVNRVTQIQDALGGLTSFAYDANGNLLEVTDAKNQITAYTYDDMDRLKTRKDALNRTESYEYDKKGNLTKFTDRKNQTTTFTYDGLNRRTGATYTDATVTYSYDAIDRPTAVNDSVGGNIYWVYDTVSSGHHPRVAETTGNGTVTVENDEIGRRLKLSATGQTDVTYTYDKNSRLKTVTQGTTTVTLAYDDAGRRTTLTYPNGVVTSYGYDNANRVETIAHVKAPTTIESSTYQYDPAGNPIQLTRANAAAALIPQAVSNTAYDAANEQIRFNSATVNLVYDNNGNLTSFTDASGTTTYTWNSRNRLSSISGPGLSGTFVYDGLGRRASKTINSTTTGYWYDRRDVLAELSGSTPTATYLRGLRMDEPFMRQLSGGTEYYQTDGLGSSMVLTDGTGTAQATYTYEPFGKTTATGTSTNAFLYTGRENDSSGLYYYRARYYSPQLQRFLNEDPIGLRGGDPNFYAYVGNSPTRLADPQGLFAPAIHREIAYTALQLEGCSYEFSKRVAEWNVQTDITYKAFDERWAYVHGQIIPGSNLQDSVTQNWGFINDQLGNGTEMGLGYAMHATEDPFSPSHQWTPAMPGKSIWDYVNLEGLEHWYGDQFPDVSMRNQAIEADRRIIQRWKKMWGRKDCE